MDTYAMTIDGNAAVGETHFDVVNPSSAEAFAQAPDCTRAQLDAAMEAARAAGPSWAGDEARRRQALGDCCSAIQTRAQDVARVLTQEQGKPLAKAAGEIMGSALAFQYTAGLEMPIEVVQDDANARIEVRPRPLGVVGAITPWNYPVLLGVAKVAPALLAGNTVVLKPSPFTPLSTLMLGEILRDVLPPGVFSVVSGGDELGRWISEHPAVRKISFTGSVETGKKVAASAASDLKRLTLELGGNDPAIVLPDVDPGEVAQKLFWSAFENSGQICSAIKRIYAHEDVYRPLVDALAEHARKVKVGDGLDPESELGPINNRPQFERVAELVADAKRHGARAVTGGERLGDRGYFFCPTLLADVEDGTRIVDEEQFGPALPVIPYRDIDDAVARANGTHFGLGGSVWTADLERGADVAATLECGTAWVNTHLNIVPYAPFGGLKWSGIGVENGKWGLAGYTELQTVYTARR
jgi:acyl-CoA reductase-like NAD-dependent aldehyde dehydrogenase